MNCLESVEQLVKTIGTLPKPKVLLIISGKRKCGKDYLVGIFRERLAQQLLTFSLSAPIKLTYAREHSLDYDQLLSDSPYKEHYRAQMVQWSDGVRALDPYTFNRLAITMAASREDIAKKSRPIWLLTDARRPADIEYFDDASEIDMRQTSVLRIRISSSQATRSARGWKFTAGVDDQQTECALDGAQKWTWDYHLQNDGTREELLEQMEPIFSQVTDILAEKQQWNMSISLSLYFRFPFL